MSALINLSINLDNLPKEKFVKGKKGTYYNFTLSVNDDTNAYGQNASAFDSQSKEQREAKEPKKYIGNGQVVWTDGTCVKAERQEESKPQQAVVSDDLPF
jgi:hypothetical protein